MTLVLTLLCHGCSLQAMVAACGLDKRTVGAWVARSAFDRWFDEPLEQFMGALADRALAYARAQQVDLTGILGGVNDWYIVDSTTVRVRDALRDEFPAAGDYAALKVHQVLSVGCGAPVSYHFSQSAYCLSCH